MKRKSRHKKFLKITIICTFIILILGVLYVSYDIMEERVSHAIAYMIYPNETNQETASDKDIVNDEQAEPDEDFTEEKIPEKVEEEIIDEDSEGLDIIGGEATEVDTEDEEVAEDIGEQEKQDENIEKDKTINGKFQEGKVAYLSFDDGPSIHVTPMILDILKNRGIPATFFVIGSMAEQNPHILKRINEDNHVIGNHTYSHRYAYIYKNTKNFGEDILKWEDSIQGILGQDFKTNIFRFPGGSFDHDKSFHDTAMDLGYEIFDWNVINGDGEGDYASRKMLIRRFKETIKNKKNPIILMHDTDAKIKTAESLDTIIQYLLDKDYVFDTLDYFNKR